MSIPQGCSVLNCTGKGHKALNGKIYYHKGFCNKHYLRARRNQDLNRVSCRDMRKAILLYDHVKIPLGKSAKGGYAVVDLDFAWLDKYKWNYTGRGYAVGPVDGKQVFMHRMIIGIPPAGKFIDHINRDGLDNRRANLRFVTMTQNTWNTGVSRNSSTGFKGVYRENRENRPPYKTQILSNGKFTYIGSFHNPEDAARAYDIKSKELNGEYAFLNFP